VGRDCMVEGEVKETEERGEGGGGVVCCQEGAFR